MSENNIVKQVCKELGVTQKELAEMIGVHEQTLRNASSANKISSQISRSIELLLENNRLKSELDKYNQIKDLIKDVLNK